MTFSALLEAMSGAALDSLVGFDRDAALAAGLEPTKVRSWGLVHSAYFGPTKFTRKQEEAVALARAGGFSIDQLVLIERRISHLLIDAQWTTRLQLLSRPCTYDALARRIRQLIPAEQKPPKKQMSFSASKAGLRRMSVTADERDMADLEHRLTRDIDPSKPVSPQMLDAFIDLLRSAAPGDNSDNSGEHPAATPNCADPPAATTSPASQPRVPYANPRPIIIVPLETHLKILSGEGDDVRLGLTDGTTMTGVEYLKARYGTELEVALFAAQDGAVNLYREVRLANQKQRDLARISMPICPVPGCRHGADSCEIHHIKAWKHGGETNIANLAPLCRYHNRVNDDDPQRRKRGRIEMVRGTPTWCSPRGYHVRNTLHPFAAMHLLFG
ncbi:HNH endonuclease [Corynebacterium glaucum]|uniref:HNH endonuclease n=1 Tax=Corynebacterium glaucum TaxID=187491 RepID=A0A1Q2HVS3_9CORY|nr:HNH endonuclease signature motif containing protein [Corynebacterium glaucum]AQQ14948.1 HNH endonuclease [Corynebacterium glaucum]